MSNLRIEHVADHNSFQKLGRVWDQLLKQSKQDRFFLTWTWISLWWQHFGENLDLWIQAVYDGKQLVGIAPLYRCRLHFAGLLPFRQLAFIGSGIAAGDHLDFFTLPGYETPVAELILESLWQQQGEWDLLYLEATSSDASLLACLAQHAHHYWHDAHLEQCPFASLPATWEAFEAGLGKNLRRNLRRYTRQLQRASGDIYPYEEAPADVLESTMQELITLHQEVRQEHGDDGAFADPRMIAFHLQLAQTRSEQHQVKLYRLMVGPEEDRRIGAVIYSIRYGKRLNYYTSGYDQSLSKFGPGRQLIGFMFNCAIQDRVEEVDFLRGDEAYKFDWTKTSRTNVYVTVPATQRGRLITLLRYLNRRLRHRHADSVRKRLKNRSIARNQMYGLGDGPTHGTLAD